MKDFQKSVIGTFTVDKEVSLVSIVAVPVPEKPASAATPKETAAYERKIKLFQPFDWVKNATRFEGGILGSEVFLPRTVAVLKAALSVKPDVKFLPAARFQKNSPKDVSDYIPRFIMKHENVCCFLRMRVGSVTYAAAAKSQSQSPCGA